MSNNQQAEQLVTQISEAMTSLADMMTDPSTINFHDVSGSFVRLEKSMHAKAYLDAAFAWLAEHSDAGRLVGSTRPAEYLIKTLNLSRREALDRIGRGRDLFSVPTMAPLPDPQPEPGESEKERQKRQEQQRKEEERRRQLDIEAQEKARERARRLDAEKQKIVRQELRNLNEHSNPSRAQLQSEALEEAQGRTPEDLRIWLRRRVSQANAATQKPDGKKDLLAGQKRRQIQLSNQDADGNVKITGSLPASTAAKLAAVLAPGLRPGVNTVALDKEDKRTRGARAVDQLDVILSQVLEMESTTIRQGVGSIIVSMTVDDVNTMTPESQFPSSTGHLLSPFDLLNLGAAKFDIGMIHDQAGKPLALGRSIRSASLYQRIALFALEGICTCGDCPEAMIHAHAHHIEAWSHGGLTDLENLTLMCPPHHSDNNDARNGAGGMGHMAKDPRTGRAGWQPPNGSSLQFNDTELQEYSTGAKVRSRSRGTKINPEWKLFSAQASGSG